MKHAILTLGILVLVAGCTSDKQRADTGAPRDAAADAQSFDGNVAHDAGDEPPLCSPGAHTCYPDAVPTMEKMLDASEFGPKAHFVASGGRAILVADGASGWSVAYVYSRHDRAADPRKSRTWSFPPGDWVGVDATHGELTPGERHVFVLACSDDKGSCAVLHASLEEEGASLVEWSSAALPAELSPSGITFNATSDAPTVCVFGHGLRCWGDSWKTEIADDAALSLEAVVYRPGLAIAVGRGGVMYERADAAQWKSLPPSGDADFIGAAVAAGQSAFISEQGSWSAGQYTALDDLCGAGHELAAIGLYEAAFYSQRGPDVSLVTRDGYLLSHIKGMPSSGYCLYERFTQGPVLGGDSVPCYLSDNLIVYTRSEVFAEQFCIETVD